MWFQKASFCSVTVTTKGFPPRFRLAAFGFEHSAGVFRYYVSLSAFLPPLDETRASLAPKRLSEQVE